MGSPRPVESTELPEWASPTLATVVVPSVSALVATAVPVLKAANCWSASAAPAGAAGMAMSAPADVSSTVSRTEIRVLM